MSRAASTGFGSFRIPMRHRLQRRLRYVPPFIVWASALAAATTLYFREEQSGVISGYAAEVVYSVASEEPGRLERLDVGLHEEVVQGQIVGALDQGALLLELHEAAPS